MHIVWFNGKSYRLTDDQYKQLRPLIKGLKNKELAIVGQWFLTKEGLIRPENQSKSYLVQAMWKIDPLLAHKIKEVLS